MAKSKDPYSKLGIREQKFLGFYCNGASASSAARRAKYPASQTGRAAQLILYPLLCDMKKGGTAVAFLTDHGMSAEDIGELIYKAKGAKVPQSPRAKRTMADAMRDHGVDDDKLAITMAEALDAQKVRFFKTQDAEGGETIEEKTSPAFDVRLRAAEMAHRLRGDFPAQRQEIKHRGQIAHGYIDLTPEFIRGIRDGFKYRPGQLPSQRVIDVEAEESDEEREMARTCLATGL